MNKKMSNEEIKNSLETLKLISSHCNTSSCEDCSFANIAPCLFFDRPWQWELGEFIEKL